MLVSFWDDPFWKPLFGSPFLGSPFWGAPFGEPLLGSPFWGALFGKAHVVAQAFTSFCWLTGRHFKKISLYGLAWKESIFILIFLDNILQAQNVKHCRNKEEKYDFQYRYNFHQNVSFWWALLMLWKRTGLVVDRTLWLSFKLDQTQWQSIFSLRVAA